MEQLVRGSKEEKVIDEKVQDLTWLGWLAV
jgi:hypothetical protein